MTVYRNCTPVADAWYDTDGEETLVVALADALAEAEGVETDDLPPLYESIDIDAIVALFERHDGPSDPQAVLSFRVDHWNVFVRADGRIRVCDGTRPTAPRPAFESLS